MMLKKHRFRGCPALFFLMLGVLSIPYSCFAAEAGHPIKIQGDYQISQDTTILIAKDDVYDNAFQGLSSGQQITVADGTSPKLTVTAELSKYNRAEATVVVAQNDATVDLRGLRALNVSGYFDNAFGAMGGKIYLGDDVTIDTTMVAAPTNDNVISAQAPVDMGGDLPRSYIEIGDRLSLKAFGDGIGASAEGVVKIGDDAKISSEIMSGLHVVNFVKTGHDDPSQITVGDRATIIAYGKEYSTYGSYHPAAVSVSDFSTVDIGGDATITSINGAGIVVKNSGARTSVGDRAVITASQWAVYADETGVVTVGDDAAITAADKRALDAEGGGVITVGSDAVVTSQNDIGAYAKKAGSKVEIGAGAAIASKESALQVEYGGTVTVGSGAAIDSQTAAALAYDTGSRIAVGDDAVITTSKQALDAEEGGLITVGDGAAIVSPVAGAFAVSGSEIQIGKDATIDSSQIMLYASDGGTVRVAGGATLTAHADLALAAFAQGGGHIELGGATIHTNGGVNDMAFYALGGGASSTIKAAGKYDVTGSLMAEGDAQIDLTAARGSYLKGASYTSGDHAVVNATMDGSQWEMTDSSRLTALALANDSNVRFGTEGVARPVGMTLTTDALSGSGNFEMLADIAAETADRLVVNGKTDGSHILDVKNTGGAATTGDERTTVVETADRGGKFELKNKTVDAGAWRYELQKNNDGKGQFDGAGGQYWELVAAGPSNPGTTGVNTFIGTYFLNYAETDTLMKRLGDLRGNADDGAWFRGFGGNMDSGARKYAGAFDMDYWGMQVGYDHKLDRQTSWFKNGDTYVGAFVGVSNGDMDFEQYGSGTGDLENHTMGMYTTYVGDNGFYFDAIAKYVWSKNEFTAHDSANQLVQGGKINTGGVGLSLETGKRINFGKEAKQNHGRWYVEPQVQLSWQHMGGGTFHADNGLSIGVDDFDSLIGRAGALVGYESDKTNIYVKASYLKEFDGEMRIKANGAAIDDSLDDDWIVYGIGVTRQMDDKNSFYVDLERAAGGEFDQDWNLNAGWRISL